LGTFFICDYIGSMNQWPGMLRIHPGKGAYRLDFVVVITCLMLACVPVAGQKVFDFNATCREAYKAIVQLKLQTGQQLLDKAKTANPDNLVPVFLENYIDFFTLFFNEDPAEYAKRIENPGKRLDLINEGPETSPFYLYCKSVIHFQWAAVRIKFGYTWDAGWSFRRSFLQAKANYKAYPSFSPNLLFTGAMQVAAGTIPDGYKWLSSLLGIKGTISEGMSRVEQFLQADDEWAQLFREEAIFYYCYLKFYVANDREGVFHFIRKQKLDLHNNHLFAYLAANLALNSQQAEMTKNIILNRKQSPEYFDMPVWDMELGYAKLFHLEPDAAFYLQRFVDRFKGKFYMKDVLQKLSWYYYLQGDQAKAEACRKKILKSGNTETEADKQAQKEAKTTQWPHPLLLRVRLLNDGGYHREAIRLLHGKTANDFALPEEKLEFAYRAGRLYDDLHADDQAIEFYKEAVTLGEKRKEYYAARAALQISFIYEQKGDKAAAIYWFQRCLSMKDHDYKNSLDQRAKAGLARCRDN
jgi:hypothetical protein